MKNNWRNSCFSALTMVLLLSLFFVSCGQKKRELNVYTWADYFKPELIERFERENNCRIVIDTFDSNEAMYAKLKAGAKGYDLVTPSSYMVSLMDQQGMVRKIRPELIPNRKNIDPEFLKITIDKSMDHSVPYMITVTGIAYLKSRVADVRPTWALFDRQDLKGRMTMFNDMRETLGAALKSLGYSLNSHNPEELDKAKEVVLRWRKNLAKFENEQYKSGLASGEFLLVHGYSGDILQVQKENPDIAFTIPEEGTAISCDDLVIPLGAAQEELAHKFINFLLDAKVAAENTEFVGYLCPNRLSYELLPREMRENPALFMEPSVRSKSEVLDDLGRANELYIRVWDQIKAAE
ncbi:MAG TPA: spermidine/putrescine ABC transporter substrate-binding protein [Candidatus Aminicenantes bacterium]|nr:spermidine/putrescine ABC transporter substrate-binding protein [Candidatus Aminicenantes bacterium]